MLKLFKFNLCCVYNCYQLLINTFSFITTYSLPNMSKYAHLYPYDIPRLQFIMAI